MQNKKQVFSKTRYQVIPRVLVFAFNNNKILLLKGSPTKKVWPNLYNGIGGHIERGEHPLQAAQREFTEETGLTLESPTLCAVITIDALDPNVGISMYVFSGSPGEGNLVSSAEGNPEWHKISDIANLDLVEDLPWLIGAINNQISPKKPIIAQYSYDKDSNLVIDIA